MGWLRISTRSRIAICWNASRRKQAGVTGGHRNFQSLTIRFPTPKRESPGARRRSCGTCRSCFWQLWIARRGMAASPAMGDRVTTPRGLLSVGGGVCLLFCCMGARAATYCVTIAGLGGEPDYEQRFTATANALDRILKTSGGDIHVFTLTGAEATRAHVEETLATVARQSKPEDDFVLVLIGHGSYDGSEYKFNLPGPDISAKEMADLLNRIPAKRQLIVNTTSASGGSIGALDKPGRAV